MIFVVGSLANIIEYMERNTIKVILDYNIYYAAVASNSPADVAKLSVIQQNLINYVAWFKHYDNYQRNVIIVIGEF